LFITLVTDTTAVANNHIQATIAVIGHHKANRTDNNTHQAHDTQTKAVASLGLSFANLINHSISGCTVCNSVKSIGMKTFHISSLRLAKLFLNICNCHSAVFLKLALKSLYVLFNTSTNAADLSASVPFLISSFVTSSRTNPVLLNDAKFPCNACANPFVSCLKSSVLAAAHFSAVT